MKRKRVVVSSQSCITMITVQSITCSVHFIQTSFLKTSKTNIRHNPFRLPLWNLHIRFVAIQYIVFQKQPSILQSIQVCYYFSVRPSSSNLRLTRSPCQIHICCAVYAFNRIMHSGKKNIQIFARIIRESTNRKKHPKRDLKINSLLSRLFSCFALKVARSKFPRELKKSVRFSDEGSAGFQLWLWNGATHTTSRENVFFFRGFAFAFLLQWIKAGRYILR